jgi:hypothetical protein
MHIPGMLDVVFKTNIPEMWSRGIDNTVSANRDVLSRIPHDSAIYTAPIIRVLAGRWLAYVRVDYQHSFIHS